MTDRYAHLIDYVKGQPWAILPETALVIQDLLRLRASGLALTEEEIQARIGAREKPVARQEGSIAVVPVFGVVAHRMNLFTEISGGTSTEKLTAQIRQLVDDPAVSAIVLDVNSPGGGVFGLTELAEEMRAARGKKRIVAIANALMASAAYWIGASADELVVTPSGQVGSIGVFSMHEDHSKLLAAEGIAVTLIQAGKFKTEGNPFEPLTDEARAAIQAQVDRYYGLFTADVAKGRRVDVETVRSGFGQGRVVSAKEALKAGMVDRVATLDEVLSDLAAGKPSETARARAIAQDIHEHQTPALLDALKAAARSADEFAVAFDTAGRALADAPQAEPAPATPEDLSDLERRRMLLRIQELGG